MIVTPRLSAARWWRAACRSLALLLLCGVQSTLAAPTSSERTTPALLVLGDSISAEYGLPRDSGWVRLLAERLKREGYAYDVQNASISGETTSGGLANIGALLERLHPAIVIVELGGNDGLRGLQLEATRANLDAITLRSQRAGAGVLIVGMQLPPNYGRAYGERFAAIYADVAKQRKAALAPFLFAGFAERFELFQPDRIHPTEAAQPRLLDNVWPALKPLLRKP
jgi:acyl-CoA thioesterase I